MNRDAIFLLAGLAGTVAVLAASRYAPAGVGDVVTETEDNLIQKVVDAAKAAWEIPSNAAQYVPTINAAADQYNIPSLLLARVLYQESRFRSDIISGAKRSPAGAIGIAQFLPSTAADLGVNPLDPVSSIYGAAKYLRQLYDKFSHDWELALAAYNWGQGNVTRKGIGAAPKETVDYYTQILADVQP